MVDTGWTLPGALDSSSNFTDPSNLLLEDGNWGQITDVDAWAQYDTFGFSIPAGATINGVEVRIKSYDTGGSGTTEIRLCKAGTVQGDSNLINTPNTSPEVWQTAVGGSSDKWSLTLTESDVENAGFGLRVIEESETVPRIDAVQMKVYYTTAVTHNLSYSDTSTLTDSISISKVTSFSKTETTSLSDTLSKTLILNRGLDDTSTLTDSVSLNIITSFSKTDTSTLSDSVSIGANYLEEISNSDITILSDILYLDALQTLNISTSDTITLSDSVEIEGLKLVSGSDVLTLSDTFSKSVNLSLGYIDTSILTDSLSINFLLNISELDTSILSDDVSLNIITSFSKTETTILSDTVYLDALQTLGISQTESLTLIDTASIVIAIDSISKSETITLIDTHSISRTVKIGNMMPFKGEYAKTKIGRMTAPTKKLINLGMVE